jgi:indolepyruvate ferredoxin oxidoreductase
MAAHLEHKGASVLDQTGLAQKGGAVTTHVRISSDPKDIHAVRIAAGEADLVLGADMVVVNDYWALSKIRAGRAKVVLNTYEAMPGTFTRNADMRFPAAQIVEAVRQGSGGTPPEMIEATELATALLGDSIATNLFMLGYAWQKGLVPVSMEAIERAIELNGAAVKMNLQAFGWGRHAAHDVEFVRRAAGLKKDPKVIDATVVDDRAISRTLDETIARRAAFLTDYQDAAYARRYTDLVARVRAAEAAKVPGSTKLAEAVARYAFKLMAYKDEYEVARLYSQPAFWAQVKQTFDGDFRVHFNLAPPLLARRDSEGHLVKSEYGPWIRHAFGLLKRLKFLRGGAFDVFGRSEERRLERQWIADYFAALDQLLAGLSRDNHHLAVEIAEVPEHIRGFGHVKERHEKAAREQWLRLLEQWRHPQAPRAAA